MAVSEQCKAAMIEHGVLMKDGKPAGMELMNKDVIRVALVEADDDGRYPAGFVNEDFESFLGDGYMSPFILDGAHKFPDGIEAIVERSFGVWYEGEIEFVALDNGPDVSVFAFGTDDAHPIITRGKASVPFNDHSDERFHSYGGESRYIGVNIQIIAIEADVDGIDHGDLVEDVMTHEAGHIFGLIHVRAAMNLMNASTSGACSPGEQQEFQNGEISHSYIGQNAGDDGLRAATEYDEGARDFIQSGYLPGGIKP